MERYLALKMALLRRQMSLAALARELGCTTTWIHKVIKGEHRSPTVEKHIARRLPEVVEQHPWPEAPRARAAR